jgi:hypothetical protein
VTVLTSIRSAGGIQIKDGEALSKDNFPNGNEFTQGRLETANEPQNDGIFQNPIKARFQHL